MQRTHRDWNIELYHRNVKQTMGHRKLLSRSPANAMVELHWIVLGYTAMTLYSVDQMNRQKIDMESLSAAAMIRAFRQTARDYMHAREAASTLDKLICRAVKDSYQRTGSKESRSYPRKKKYKPPGVPKILMANAEQKLKTKQLKKPSLAA